MSRSLLAPVAEARRLDGQDRDGPAELVHDEGGERLTVHVLGDDHHRLALLDRLLERGQEVFDRRDLPVGDEDERILEDRLHPVHVGDEVRREVAPVELHPLGEFGLEAQAAERRVSA